MKKSFIIIVAALLAAAACDDDGGPEGPKELPSEYNGTFDVDFALQQTDCSYSPPLDGSYIVTINDTVFEWGDATGTWDEENKRGHGTSEEQCIPHPPPVGCISCYVIEFDITFASPDSFYGEAIIPFTHNVECQAPNCESTFDVTGTRVE